MTGDPQCSECGQFLAIGHRPTCSQWRWDGLVWSKFATGKTLADVEGDDVEPPADVCHRMSGLPPADPWAHRSAKMRCRTCMWFVGKAKPGGDPLFPQEFGRCRRHAPTMSGYPVVFPDDWCGDHKLDEAKA